MLFLVTFLEGIISFLSPCMLPMLPIYISYFAGGADKKRHIFFRSLAFVLGFTSVFCLLGLFAGTVGAFLATYRTAVNIVCGLFVILFGLSYLEIIPLPFFKGMQGGKNITSVFSAFLFGIIYSVSLSPCIGAFLGSALSMAATAGTAVQGVLLLLAYSLGLGLPFLLSALLIDQLSGAFTWIKKHYRIINLVCGIFLILVGVLMACGLMNLLLAAFS